MKAPLLSFQRIPNSSNSFKDTREDIEMTKLSKGIILDTDALGESGYH